MGSGATAASARPTVRNTATTRLERALSSVDGCDHCCAVVACHSPSAILDSCGPWQHSVACQSQPVHRTGGTVVWAQVRGPVLTTSSEVTTGCYQLLESGSAVHDRRRSALSLCRPPARSAPQHGTREKAAARLCPPVRGEHRTLRAGHYRSGGQGGTKHSLGDSRAGESTRGQVGLRPLSRPGPVVSRGPPQRSHSRPCRSPLPLSQGG